MEEIEVNSKEQKKQMGEKKGETAMKKQKTVEKDREKRE